MVSFPEDFAIGRSYYPFTHMYIHRYENRSESDIVNKDKDILTTLYIDADLNIRGVENLLLEKDSNILSKETSKEINAKLTNALVELHSEYDELLKKYNNLYRKYNKQSSSKKSSKNS